MIYNNITTQLETLYRIRIANCVRVAEGCSRDSWAYNYWMTVAGKLTLDLEASLTEVH